MGERPSSTNQLTPELAIVADFLRQYAPFDQLPDKIFNRLVSSLQVGYFRKGHVFQNHEVLDGLGIIRSGAAELWTSDDQLIDRLEEGVSFNLHSLNQEHKEIRLVLIEDSLLYFLSGTDFKNIRKSNKNFNHFFHSQRSSRLRRAARHGSSPAEIMRPVSEVMSKNIISVNLDTTIQHTAELMTINRISSMLVMDNEKLLGIITDRDIRSRAVAKGIHVEEPIKYVMTPSPEFIAPSASLFDAILFMTKRGFHHIPVVEQQQVVGMLTSSDVMLARQDDPVFLVQHISREKNIAGIKHIVRSLPQLLVQWVNAGIRAEQVAHILTAVSDSVTTRLIQLAIDELGPAPVPFCWLGFGSQARGEQLIGADQDNGLLIANEASEKDLEWFQQLANSVCDGLNECGYPYCNGGVMASTDEWRQRLNGWKHTVNNWTDSPTPDAVMRVSIFFDLRAIYGDSTLADQLQEHMLTTVKRNTIFLAALAENVITTPPPLGIFRRFVVERDGEHRDQLNLKKSAVLIMVDMVRLHALAHHITEVNTRQRLQALVKSKALTMKDSRNLQDAFQLIMQTRLQNQAQQITSGEGVNNFIDPSQLSTIARKQLRDTFTVVADEQQAVKNRYRQGLGS